MHLHKLAVCLFVGIAALVGVESAHAASIDLGTAGPNNWAILTLGGGISFSETDTSLNTATNIGNVGIAAKPVPAPSSDLSVSGCCAGAAIVQGNVYLDTNATLHNSGNIQGTAFVNSSAGQVSSSGTLSGGVVVDGTVHAKLAQAVSDAQTFAALYGGFSCTICSTTNIDTNSGTTVITGVNGLNVLNLTDLKLNGDSTTLQLTATGAAARFIINVSGTFNLAGGDIILGGDLTPDEVLINYTGTTTLHTSGPHANINGILLAPKADIGFSNAIITGEVIAGGDSVQIVSGSYVHAADCCTTVPEPGALMLLTLGLGAVGVAVRRRGRSGH